MFDAEDGQVVAVDMMKDVEDFHVKFGQGYDGKPRMLPHDLFSFRSKFHHEESQEYDNEQLLLEEQASIHPHYRDEDVIIGALEKQLDALVDSVFVHLGTAYVQFGRAAFNEAWRRVCVANMAKVRQDSGVEGCVDSGRGAPKFDIVKPPGWTPPDHTDLVTDYEPLPENA